MKKILVILSLLSLAACTDLEPRQLTFPQKIAKQVKTIENNGFASASTRTYILKEFGKPEDMFVLDQSGTEVWKYNISDVYENGVTKSYEFIVTMLDGGKIRSYTLTPVSEKANSEKYWLNQKMTDPKKN